MKISTIILNWNRASLLEATLASYAVSVEGNSHLFVVDNGSSDNSKEVIEAAIVAIPELEFLYLDTNYGGEAINFALDRILNGLNDSDLIQIAENDQLFLPGWPAHARDTFARFPQLGQLSLHGVVQSDDEIGNPLQGQLRFEHGSFLYETLGNVGTASILRAHLLKDGGIRIHNIQTEVGSFKFPNDSRLSADVRSLGYFCAWSHKPYTQTLGHHIGQIENDLDYYVGNYSTKSWLGLEGLYKLITEARNRPPAVRRSVVFSDQDIQPEWTAQYVGNKPSRLWSMFDAWTPEVESLDFLYTLVRLLKPCRLVETGTWLGRSATAIGSALRDNGFGLLTTIEINTEAAIAAQSLIAEFGLEKLVSVRIESSLSFAPDGPYDFGIFASNIEIRAAEFLKFYEFLEVGAVVIFHDTAPHNIRSADAIYDFITMGLLEGLFFPTPRGVFVGKLIKPARPLPGDLRQLPYGFDPEAYCAANPDIAAACVDPGEHYRIYGWREGRRLTPVD